MEGHDVEERRGCREQGEIAIPPRLVEHDRFFERYARLSLLSPRALPQHQDSRRLAAEQGEDESGRAPCGDAHDDRGERRHDRFHYLVGRQPAVLSFPVRPVHERPMESHQERHDRRQSGDMARYSRCPKARRSVPEKTHDAKRRITLRKEATATQTAARLSASPSFCGSMTAES